MFRHLIIVGCLLAFASAAEAQWVTWTDGTGNHKWTDKRNWNLKRLPTSRDVGVDLRSLPGPVLAKAAEIKAFISIGTAHDASLRIAKGGRLAVKTAVSLGCRDGVKGTLIMEPGSTLITDQIYIGNGNRSFGGHGRLIMNGGLIQCTYFSLQRARALKARAHVTLKGGVVNCWDFMLCRESILPPKVDVWGGKVVQRRNDVKRVRDWIAAKWIVAYGGKGQVVVRFDPQEHPNCTVITATRP